MKISRKNGEFLNLQNQNKMPESGKIQADLRQTEDFIRK
jgi:hypothetical protein